jgi:hypothetical protein
MVNSTVSQCCKEDKWSMYYNNPNSWYMSSSLYHLMLEIIQQGIRCGAYPLNLTDWPA